MNMLELMDFVKEKHKGQKYGKLDYFKDHIMKVYDVINNAFYYEATETILKTALCHDLLEDTSVTYDELVEVTDMDVAGNVVRLTRSGGKNYTQYILDLVQCTPYSPETLLVKMADLQVNIRKSISKKNGCKIKGIKYDRQDRLDKYSLSLHIVRERTIIGKDEPK